MQLIAKLADLHPFKPLHERIDMEEIRYHC